MCGFLGRTGILDQLPPLDRGLPLLKRRGPDSQHYWRSASGAMELLQARLAIVDPFARSDQPFKLLEYGLTVAFNGEIYNYQEIRPSLETKHHFQTQSDTEVLLAAYALGGLEGIKDLRGMFSFAIVDERNQETILARDPVGKKPLYVAFWPGGAWFGSTLMAMAASAPTKPSINPLAIAHYFKRGFISPATSILEGARPLRPGEVLVLDSKGNIKRQDTCRPQKVTYSFGDFEKSRSEMLAQLDLAVKRRLHNNPNPVTLLSGGIDSTIIADRLSRLTKFKALTLKSWTGHDSDEWYAKFAAKKMKIPIESVGVNYSDIAGDVKWSAGLQDEPLGMISFFPLCLLLRAAKAHGKILFTGEGGDEVFLGYGKPTDWTDLEFEKKDYIEEEVADWVGPDNPPWMSPWGRFTTGFSMLGHIFSKADRASAEQGVELRSPLLGFDHINMTKQMPPEWMFTDGKAKGLLKSYLKESWPDWYINRRKMGFPFRIRYAWGVRLYSGLRDLVSEKSMEISSAYLPTVLCKSPKKWSSLAIFRNFAEVWKAVMWSQFQDRYDSLSHS